MNRFLVACVLLVGLALASAADAAPVRRWAGRPYYRPGYGYVGVRSGYYPRSYGVRNYAYYGGYGYPRTVSYGWGYPGVAYGYPGYAVGNPYYYYQPMPSLYYGLGVSTGTYGAGFGYYGGWPGAYSIGY
jgi:hypothetical protein